MIDWWIELANGNVLASWTAALTKAKSMSFSERFIMITDFERLWKKWTPQDIMNSGVERICFSMGSPILAVFAVILTVVAVSFLLMFGMLLPCEAGNMDGSALAKGGLLGQSYPSRVTPQRQLTRCLPCQFSEIASTTLTFLCQDIGLRREGWP